MKQFLLFMFAIVISVSMMGQTATIPMSMNHEGEYYSDHGSPIFSSEDPGNYPTDNLTLWALPSNGGTSANSRAPGNTYRYQRCEYLILPSEMAASGLPSGSIINGIGYWISTAGVGSITGTFNVYLMNTTDVSYTLGTSWNVTGFTQVLNNTSWTVPIALGTYDVPFTGGSSFTYTGGGVYVAWEFSYPTGTLGTTHPVHQCNNSLPGLLYSARHSSSMPTALSASAFRPATRFTTSSYDDLIDLSNIYTTEKTPVPYNNPCPIGVRVANVSTDPQTFDVTVEVRDQATSTLRYTATQAVTSLAAGSSTTVSFTGYAPTILENVNITAFTSTLVGENWTVNNTKTIPATVNNNLYSYYYGSPAPSTGYGFTYSIGGIFTNKYHIYGSGSIPSANLFVYNYAANVGRTIYAVVLNSAGTIVAQSANLVITTPDMGTNKNFTFPTPPTFTDEDFYVGLAQSTAGATVAWYPMGSITEDPQRGSTFYTFSLTGGTPTMSTSPYKYMIEALVGPVSIAHDVGTLSIDDIPSSITLPATITPKATVKNFGVNTETFDVTMITTGYTSTKTVTNLASLTTTQVTFDPWTPAVGQYSIQVCTQLTGDLEPTNDCKTQVAGVYTGSWSSGNAIPTGTYLGTGSSYVEQTESTPVGHIFSVGGNTTLGTEVFEYNVNTNTWSTKTPLPAGRRVLGSAIVGDYLYAIGGSDMASVYQSTVYRYSISGNSWTTVASLPIAIAWGKAVAYQNNYIYFVGGHDGTNYLATVYVYDIAANTWTAATSMPGARIGGALGISGNQLVYVAGADPSFIVNTVYVGTIDSGNPYLISWSTKSPFPGTAPGATYSLNHDFAALEAVGAEIPGIEPTDATPYPGGTMYRFDGATWGADGIIVANGSNTSAWSPAVPNPCYSYDVPSDTWTKQGDVPTPVLGASLGSVNLSSGSDYTWKLVVASGLGVSATTTVTQIWADELAPSMKTLNLTLFLEGLWNGVGMNEAQNDMGSQWGAGVADHVTVELHDGTTPYGLVWSQADVPVSTSGAASISTIPAIHSSSYYLVIKHRNSVETWSGAPVSFAGSPITYNFTDNANKAFGDNQANLGSGAYGIYGGDVNLDGILDSNDLGDVDNDANNFVMGYVATDANGDGVVDSNDMGLVDNNANAFIMVIVP